MKKLVIGFVTFMASAFHDITSAQIDRAGNVMDDRGSSGEGIVHLISGGVIGALVGSAYGWHKNSQAEKKIAIDGCAITGGLIGIFVSPLLPMLLK